MKRIMLYMFVILCFVIVSSCAVENDKQSANDNNKKEGYDTNEYVFSTKDKMLLSLDETVSFSTNIVKAKYIGTVYGDYSEGLFFEIEDQYKGNTDTKTIRINYQYDFLLADGTPVTHEKNYSYVPGEDYLLFLDCIDYVYLDQKMYRVISETYFPFNDIDEARLNGELLKNSGYDFKNTQELLAHISDIPDQSQVYYIKYTRSNDVFEISQKADVIAKIKALEHIRYISLFDADVYECELTEVSKGNIDPKNVEIVFFKDSVKADEEYVVYLVDTHIDGYYFLASPYGYQRAGVSDRD